MGAPHNLVIANGTNTGGARTPSGTGTAMPSMDSGAAASSTPILSAYNSMTGASGGMRGIGGTATASQAANQAFAEAGPRGHWDPMSGVFVMNDTPSNFRQSALGMKKDAVSPGVQNQVDIMNLLSQVDAERRSGYGVRPGATPPMNAVQYSRMAAGWNPGVGNPNQVAPVVNSGGMPAGTPMSQMNAVGIGGSQVPVRR